MMDFEELKSLWNREGTDEQKTRDYKEVALEVMRFSKVQLMRFMLHWQYLPFGNNFRDAGLQNLINLIEQLEAR